MGCDGAGAGGRGVLSAVTGCGVREAWIVGERSPAGSFVRVPGDALVGEGVRGARAAGAKR